MGYRVSGILKLPDGTPANNAEIEFISRKNFSPLVQELKSNIKCSATGAYDVTLEYGEYAVVVYPGGTYPAALGTIILAADTVAGQDLPTLLQQAGWQPATQEYITQINTWLAQANASADRANNEASRATTQADKAKGEADRAAQITGINTVMDAIALAAIPLPDVWAPLSDSLRLITGYGRDVLVGSDVVARMVNFSRSSTATYIGKGGLLKTAAANEPRFEKEGLLIEGQSTNLWLVSEGASQLGAAVSTAVAASGFNLRTYTGTEPANKDVAVPQSTTITVSAAFLVNGTPCKIAVQSRDGQGFTSWFGIDASGNVAVHPTITFAAVSSVRVGNVVRVAVTLPPLALTTTLRLYRWDSTSVQGDTFGCIQVEPLPFASSYIPTAGAAVTRAPDKAWIQTAGNISASPFTVAMEVNFRGVNSTGRYARLFTCGPACYAFFTDIGMSGRFNATSPVTAFSLNPIGRAVSGMVFNGATAKLFSAKKFGPASAISALTDADVSGDLILGSPPTLSSSDTLFGHIRDVKIWRRTLTDDQIKAVA